MATAPVSMRLGGPITLTGDGTRVRLRLPPLLPGDRVDNLILHLGSTASTGVAPATLQIVSYSVAVSEQQPTNTDAAFDNLSHVLLPSVQITPDFHLINPIAAAVDGFWKLVLTVPLMHFVTTRERYVTLDIFTLGDSTLAGAAYFGVHREVK